MSCTPKGQRAEDVFDRTLRESLWGDVNRETDTRKGKHGKEGNQETGFTGASGRLAFTRSGNGATRLRQPLRVRGPELGTLMLG